MTLHDKAADNLALMLAGAIIGAIICAIFYNWKPRDWKPTVRSKMYRCRCCTDTFSTCTPAEQKEDEKPICPSCDSENVTAIK